MINDKSRNLLYVLGCLGHSNESSALSFIYIYTNLPANAIVRLPHPRSRDSQGQETFLAPSADKQTRNHEIEYSNHHPSLSTLRSKGLSRSKMKW